MQALEAKAKITMPKTNTPGNMVRKGRWMNEVNKQNPFRDKNYSMPMAFIRCCEQGTDHHVAWLEHIIIPIDIIPKISSIPRMEKSWILIWRA